MEDDTTSTATMTSVTDELSVDELEVTGNDLETSSQITTSDAMEEGNTTVVDTPLLQLDSKHVDLNSADKTSGDDSGKGNISTTTKEQNSTPGPQPGKCQQPTAGFSDAGDPPEKGIQFPNLLSMPGNWYEHHCFDRYWRHYQFVSMWCQKHMQVYRTVSQQYKKMIDHLEAARRTQKPHSQSDAHVFKKPTSSRTIRNRKARRRRKAAKKRMRMALKNAEMAGSGSSFSQSLDEGQSKAEVDKEGETTESAVEGTEEEEMQIEISEEMLDFFAHTHKHRQERGMVLIVEPNINCYIYIYV